MCCGRDRQGNILSLLLRMVGARNSSSGYTDSPLHLILAAAVSAAGAAKQATDIVSSTRYPPETITVMRVTILREVPRLLLS